jgi:hypothetical protein
MKWALIVLTLELALLGVAVAADLAGEGRAVRWPPAVAASTPPVREAASPTVPVSISLAGPIGTVETAALARGGRAAAATGPGRVAVKARAATR